MNSYRLNPYAQFVENHIFPSVIQYGVFHRLTGEVIEPSPNVRSLLLALRLGSPVSFADSDLATMGQDGHQIKLLIEKELLLDENRDPLSSFLDQYLVRPRQNPAVAYQAKTGGWIIVRTTMAQRIFSPAVEELPNVIEEALEPMSASLFLAADGSRTLAEVCQTIPSLQEKPLPNDELRKAIDFLTGASRQLIKFTRNREDLANPFMPCNIVPRNMYPSKKAKTAAADVSVFHQEHIDDAAGEFDFVEPTINHSLRFENEALAGLNYGARFCASTLRAEVLAKLDELRSLEVLEVGGGTGSFAAGFLTEARKPGYPEVSYRIVDLSPTLIASQRQRLAHLDMQVQHFEQNATQLNIPDQKFDLIISNEVIADFPVAEVSRNGKNWQGPGLTYLDKYGLADPGAATTFLINTGAISFLERAWQHLSPGGVLLVSEYGDEATYPVQAYHLNHEEYSIHFGHLKKCAEQIGFRCRLMPLQNFLNIDDQISMLDGQEEQILCLNQVFKDRTEALPFALITESEFKTRYGELVEQLNLIGVTFSPLSNGFHFGPKLSQFMLLVMNKPE